MIGRHRPRRMIPYVVVSALAMAIVACTATGTYPNTTFEPRTDLGRAIDDLWGLLLLLGTIVFVVVEVALLFVVWKYRHRPGQPEPKQVHGSTSLEILWTLIPAVVLVFIAVPTVRTIFETQAAPPQNALRIQVIGHQWWWEFRYPDFDIVTANEFFIPTGHPVHFELQTRDVLHSFWIPQLGAKRDLISNKTNHIWFTSDTTAGGVWNGFCTEFCGASHANMHFRAFTVSPEEFERWAAWQRTPAAFPGTVPAAPSAPEATTEAAAEAEPDALQPPAPQPGFAAYQYPPERFPEYAVPNVPLPPVPFQDDLVGDPVRGQQVYSTQACIGCHRIRGNPMSLGIIGPDLTHFGSRYTLAAGMYPNDTRHLARWIKNAPALKPGSLMPAMGRGEYDPRTRMVVTPGLDDQQIADIAAYLQALR